MTQQSGTTREPITYDLDGSKVFGVLHRPLQAAAQGRPGIAIFHGFLGSKDQPHRIFVTLAEELARAGFVALRIDFLGRGDSEGESVDISVEADLAAAQRAVDYLAAQADVDGNRLGLVGLSWGGSIAACLAGRDNRISSTALWSAVPAKLNWKPQLQLIDGRQVAEMWGNIVGAEFYAGLHKLDPVADIRQARGPLLLVYGTDDDLTPAAAVEAFRLEMERLGKPLRVVAVAGADHAFMAHSWERHVISQTVEWLSSTMGALSE